MINGFGVVVTVLNVDGVVLAVDGVALAVDGVVLSVDGVDCVVVAIDGVDGNALVVNSLFSCRWYRFSC